MKQAQPRLHLLVNYYKEWHIKGSTDSLIIFGFTVKYGSYTTCSLPATYILSRSISSWYNTNFKNNKCRELGRMINHFLLLLHLFLYFSVVPNSSGVCGGVVSHTVHDRFFPVRANLVSRLRGVATPPVPGNEARFEHVCLELRKLSTPV